MRRECRERFPRHRLQRKPLVSDPGMHYGTCVTHVPWCISGSLNLWRRGKRYTGILGTCATRNFTYLVSGPCDDSVPLESRHGRMIIGNDVSEGCYSMTIICEMLSHCAQELPGSCFRLTEVQLCKIRAFSCFTHEVHLTNIIFSLEFI